MKLPLLPEQLQNLIALLEDRQFYLCLVGGATRDFLMTGILPCDLDFEIRGSGDFELLKKDLIEQGSAEVLAFNIIRLKTAGYEIELSPPRIETYRERDFSHKNFDVEFDLNLDYIKSFKRRDFTINAIGFEYRQGFVKLIDPFGGLADLKNNLLRGIDDCFTLDPVRLLRTIRFSLNYNLSVHTHTTSLFSEFNLEQISSYYMLKEADKSGMPVLFYATLFKYLDQYGIAYNIKADCLRHLASVESKASCVVELLGQIKKDKRLSGEIIKSICHYLQISFKKL